MNIINDCIEFLYKNGADINEGRVIAILSQAIGENYYIPDKKYLELMNRFREQINFERHLLFCNKALVAKLYPVFLTVTEFLNQNDQKYGIRKYKTMFPAAEFNLAEACGVNRARFGYARIARDIVAFCADKLKSYGVHAYQIADILNITLPALDNIRLRYVGCKQELKKLIADEYTEFVENFHKNAKYCKVEPPKRHDPTAERFSSKQDDLEVAAKQNALNRARLVAQFPPLPNEKKVEKFTIESILRPEYSTYLQVQ